MIKYVIKEKTFLIGFSFIFVLLAASIGNTLFNDGKIRQVPIMYQDGEVVGAPPFPPSFQFLLGTDEAGYDLLHVIVQGAKFTIGLSACIAIKQVVCAVVVGVGIGTFLKRWSSKLESFFDSFTIVPLTIIAYFLLINVLTMPMKGFQQPFYQRALFEMFILTILAVPTTAFYVVNEVKKLFTKEFVEAASVLGGSKLHLVRKHIFPYLLPSLLILLVQQFNKVLLVLAHLGVLKMFFGGTVIDYSPQQEPPKTLSFEWSGLIGDKFSMIFIHPWIALVPIVFFSLTVIAANLVLMGLQNAMEKVESKVADGKEESHDIDAKQNTTIAQ
ncbi:peptide ABC transporter permease [Bacillus manliponensis]|uniref:Peptide ABC transporter permease n=1 Tax=Bacillus manliponensis TaxID=574376 RepID=A0A073JXZ0_9BACI|nr:ABC transporter permease subunit [Bacillus manliponensis]KEK19082.1 peptide ABC transporter permease [Bacillus manliponensis]